MIKTAFKEKLKKIDIPNESICFLSGIQWGIDVFLKSISDGRNLKDCEKKANLLNEKIHQTLRKLIN